MPRSAWYVCGASRHGGGLLSALPIVICLLNLLYVPQHSTGCACFLTLFLLLLMSNKRMTNINWQSALPSTGWLCEHHYPHLLYNRSKDYHFDARL